MGDSENIKLNSIDILEECLNSIHRCRKKSLVEKINRHRTGANHRSHTIVSSDEEQKISSAPNRARLDQQKHVAVTDLRHDSEAFRESRPEARTTSSSQQTAPSEQKKLVKQQPPAVKEFFPSTKLEGKSSLDIRAEEALVSLRKEIISWSSKHPEKVEDEDARGDFADYLTEKYLCNILDPMPSSSVITKVRKQLSLDLDAFVASGPAGLPSTLFSDSSEVGLSVATDSVRSSIDASKSSLPAAVGLTRESQIKRSFAKAQPESKKTGDKILEASFLSAQAKQAHNQDTALKKLEERKKLEKDKIKEQYEKFRKLKADSEEIKRSDNVKQAEENLDDIKKLLTSLQSSK